MRTFTIDGGSVEWGHEAAVGYFAQDHRATIQPGLTMIDWLQQFDPTAGNEELRGLLGQMLFARDEAMKPTEALSGGEAARLIFCRLMLQKPNILVLDEPTNHLDLESINALNIALQKYEGTIFLVTHDHDLLEEMATRIWRFDGKTIEDFKGVYTDFKPLTLKQYVPRIQQGIRAFTPTFKPLTLKPYGSAGGWASALCFSALACAQQDPLAWFPLEVGNRSIYEHESKSGNRDQPRVDHFTTEETITGTRPVPEGLMVFRDVRELGGAAGPSSA